MVDQRYLVTGAAGCIGAWVTQNLRQAGADVVALDLAEDRRRLRYLMGEEELSQVQYVQGDITDHEAVRQLVLDREITHIIHLAALQIPFCRADPLLGARVNVVGTASVFEAARAAGIRHLAYASSAAVFGPAEEYKTGPLSHDAPLRPRTLYGVYKQANEGMARVYWLEAGISSIGLRPYVVYGVGRDQGMTSTPTTAMLAAAVGAPYHISYGGRFNMQYASDVADTFIQAARTSFEGAEAFNLRGAAVHMEDVIAAIERARPQIAGSITFEEQSLPFPPDLDDSALVATVGSLPSTPLVDGVLETVEMFSGLVSRGALVHQY